MLDTRDLTIEGVTAPDGAALPFTLGDEDRVIGRPLTVRLPEGIKEIVKSWPARFDTARAESLGFPRDEGGFERIIDAYVRDEGLKLKL